MTTSRQLLTESAERIIGRFRQWGIDQEHPAASGQLVVAMLLDESLAGTCLSQAGITLDTIRHGQLGKPAAQLASESQLINDSAENGTVAPSLENDRRSDSTGGLPFNESAMGTPVTRDCNRLVSAREFARHDPDGITSLHLLAVVVSGSDAVAKTLTSEGLTPENILSESDGSVIDPIPVPSSFELADDSAPSVEIQSMPLPGHALGGSFDRVLDACLNRAREGARVLEDYARFVLDDGRSVRRLKDLRHRLVAAEDLLPNRVSTENRDVAGDIGTSITTSQEQHRADAGDIVEANARRVQEALRSLEEFGKLVHGGFAATMKQLRYEAYDVHQSLRATTNDVAFGLLSGEREKLNARHLRLQRSLLCVLISESNCRAPWEETAQSALDGGADILQLREKHLSDRELTRRAAWLSECCDHADALCIVNDRPDIARMSGADGVHLGQDDCSAAQARDIVGDDLLLGVSTHCMDDMEDSAILCADYLGAGPVFASATKEFATFAGLEFIRQLDAVSKPWFAIGGISLDNISEVTAAGATRIAVSSAVLQADCPAEVSRQIREVLQAADCKRERF